MDIRSELSEKYNSLTFEQRKNYAGLGYVLAQMTTIKQVMASGDISPNYKKKLRGWLSNIERSAKNDYIYSDKTLISERGKK